MKNELDREDTYNEAKAFADALDQKLLAARTGMPGFLWDQLRALCNRALSLDTPALAKEDIEVFLSIINFAQDTALTSSKDVEIAAVETIAEIVYNVGTSSGVELFIKAAQNLNNLLSVRNTLLGQSYKLEYILKKITDMVTATSSIDLESSALYTSLLKHNFNDLSLPRERLEGNLFRDEKIEKAINGERAE